MKLVPLILAASLAGCSMFESKPAPVAKAPPPPQSEVPAATRDSSTTPEQIKAVQTQLAREGYYHGPIDGVWGPTTSDALSKYQTAHNMNATGKLETPSQFGTPRTQ